MSTMTVVETMAQPTPPSINTTATATTTGGESLSIKAILASDLTTSGPAPTSPDDGFYSAAMFDSVDEEAFIQAQRDAFAAISDAALAQALQESEIYAAKKAAEENRRKIISGSFGTSSAGTASRVGNASSSVTAAPAAGRYAVWSPTEQPQAPRSTASRRPTITSEAAPVAFTSTSPVTSRSSPPPAKPSHSRSQYPSSASTSSSLSLSVSASYSPSSRISATTSYRPSTPAADRQPSSRYYAQNSLPTHQQQPQSAATASSQAKMAPVSSTFTTTSQMGGPTSASASSSSTINSSAYYSSTIPSTSTSAKPSSFPAPSATPRPRAMSRATPTSWNQPSSSSSPSSSPPPQAAPRSTPPTTASARDLRMGVLLVPSRPVEVSSGSAKPAGRPMATRASTPRPRPQASAPRRKTPRTGRSVVVRSESELKWAKAKNFLSSNLERECPKCGEDVEGPEGSAPIPSEPFSHNLLKYIHVTCSNPECGATYCRGCFASVEGRCRPTETSSSSTSGSTSSSRRASPSRPSNAVPPTSSATATTGCRGSRGCDIKSCCPFASVVAISSILDALDAECVRAAIASGFSSPASDVREARAFVDVVIARSDVKNTRVFEGAMMRGLHAVSSWLQVLGERREEETRSTVDPVRDLLYPLIKHSLLPSLVHAFLQNRNVGDWLRHSEIYVCILEVLRRLVDQGLGKVLDEPIVAANQRQRRAEEEGEKTTSYHWRSSSLGSGEESSTSESSADELDDDSSESDGETETDNTSVDEDDGEEEDEDTEDENEGKRRTWNASEYYATSSKRMAAAAAASQQLSIKALVSKLEEHRGPLMAVGANVKFPATKMKVHTLCDGISYLLLQQVMAMD